MAEIQQREPTGDGALLQWDPSGAPTRWECVDDLLDPDDDTTHISTSTVGNDNLSTFAAFSIASDGGPNTVVKVVFRARKVNAGACSVRPSIRVNGVVYYGTAVALATTYGASNYEWLVNPDTGLDWTDADVNGSGPNPLQQVGVELESATANTARCTLYYVQSLFDAPVPADDGLVAAGPQPARRSQPANFRRRFQAINRIARYYSVGSPIPPAELVAEEMPPGLRSSPARAEPSRLFAKRLAGRGAYWIAPSRGLAAEEPPEPEASTFIIQPALPHRLINKNLRRMAARSAYWWHNPSTPPAEDPDLASDCAWSGGAWVPGLDAAGGVFISGVKRCKAPGHWGRAHG